MAADERAAAQDRMAHYAMLRVEIEDIQAKGLAMDRRLGDAERTLARHQAFLAHPLGRLWVRHASPRVARWVAATLTTATLATCALATFWPDDYSWSTPLVLCGLAALFL